MKTKTSLSHPLRIDAVTTPGGGQISMTLCPGKVKRESASGPWARDLAADIAVIRAWGARAVVTLMEDHELRAVRVGDLGQMAEATGLEWHHLPVRDVGVPNRAFEDVWLYSGHRLRRLLTAGGRVLLHCMGGLGRTGTIAVRLLVELGVAPRQALAEVRAVRPGAVETSAQERYALKTRPPLDGQSRFDHVLGCLLGGAVGDAFGYAVEFHSVDRIVSCFGPAGIAEPVAVAGQFVVSDDTQMTLFTLEGLARSASDATLEDPEAVTGSIRLAYLDWLDTQSGRTPSRAITGGLAAEPRLRHRRAPGNTCLSALRVGGHGRPDRPVNDSKGCGGVKRVAPIGLVPSWQPALAFDIAARAAALTHGHPSGYLSAGALALMVNRVAAGLPLRDAARSAIGVLAEHDGAGETMAALKVALTVDSASNHQQAIARLGQGWVGEEALAIGLYAALAAASFPEALQIAANHDGDSDSTASIAGQLYGAVHGLADLPHAWVRKVDLLEPLLGVLRRLTGEPGLPAEKTPGICGPQKSGIRLGAR